MELHREALCRQRMAVEDQISHFGQTPSQLFRRKHPKRGPPPSPCTHPLLNGPDAMKLSLVGMPPSRRCSCCVSRCTASCCLLMQSQSKVQ